MIDCNTEEGGAKLEGVIRLDESENSGIPEFRGHIT